MKENRLGFISQQVKNIESEITRRNSEIFKLEEDLAQLRSENNFDSSLLKVYREEVSKLKRTSEEK